MQGLWQGFVSPALQWLAFLDFEIGQEGDNNLDGASSDNLIDILLCSKVSTFDLLSASLANACRLLLQQICIFNHMPGQTLPLCRLHLSPGTSSPKESYITR